MGAQLYHNAVDPNFVVNYMPLAGHNTVKVLMYLASMSTQKTFTNSQIFQHNDVFNNFSLDRSCLSRRD